MSSSVFFSFFSHFCYLTLSSLKKTAALCQNRGVKAKVRMFGSVYDHQLFVNLHVEGETDIEKE